jgi:hypothetical protein
LLLMLQGWLGLNLVQLAATQLQALQLGEVP